MTIALHDYQPEVDITIHKDIRFHPCLNAGEKLFYAEIKSMTKTKTCPFLSRQLCDIFGVTHQTIHNWVKKLVELDLIEVELDYRNPECRLSIKTKNFKSMTVK